MKNRCLLFFLLGSLILINGCQKEMSFEGGAGPSEGTLQDDGNGDCLPMSVVGTYVIGTALNGTTNYIEVQVSVSVPGSYSIHTDTANGIYFQGAGVFTAAGLTTVRLKGNGTPLATGVHGFVVTYGTSGCTISVTTSGSLATFTLNGAPGGCVGATPAGTYAASSALNASNTVTINVNVTALGAYSISTAPANGIIFTGSGTFTTLGAQAIVLSGSGTPVTAGVTNIPVTAGASSCSFPVTVNAAAAPATYTINCAAAVINGTYTVGTALNAATNTIGITVNVATAGSYTITGTINNMTFTASGTFAAAGAGQNVTLTGSGNPTTSGANIVPLTGGTAGCNVTVTVNPGAGGVAVFTVDCSTAFLNGYLTKGVPIAPVNSISIDVTVTTPGTYTITTTPVNGITYTASGNFAAAGAFNVILSGVGSTPLNSGTFTINVPSGTTPCSFTVDVDPNFGSWTFRVGATTYSGTIYDAGFDNTQLTPPATLFFLNGDDAAGNLFDLGLGDANGTVANGETYKGAPPVTGNIAALYYTGVGTGPTYEGDPITVGLETNTITATVTTHNTATKTITGTFSGKAILNGGTTLVDITNGAFTVTYP